MYLIISFRMGSVSRTGTDAGERSRENAPSHPSLSAVSEPVLKDWNMSHGTTFLLPTAVAESRETIKSSETKESKAKARASSFSSGTAGVSEYTSIRVISRLGQHFKPVAALPRLGQTGPSRRFASQPRRVPSLS